MTPFIDFAIHNYVGDNPINHVDPLGLASTTAPGTQPVQQPVTFVETNDFRLSGTEKVTVYFNIDHKPKGLEGFTTPNLTTTYEILNNYYQSAALPGAKQPITYPVPKDAGKGYTNSIPVHFTGGIPVNLPVDNKALAIFFNDYAYFDFDGILSTKQRCERFAGSLKVTVSGDIIINGVDAKQKEKSQSINFDFGNPNAKTFVGNASGSVKRESDWDKKDYGIFKIDGGSVQYTLEIDGKLYK